MKKYILIIAVIVPVLLFSNNQVFKKFDINQGLSNNSCQGLAIDRQGFLWIGTESGLNRFDGDKFKNYYSSETKLNSINSNELNDVYADKTDDIIWVGTERMGLNAYNYSTHKFTHYVRKSKNLNGISSNGVMSLSGESSGNLWVSTYEGGVDLLDKKNNRFIHYNQSTIQGLVSNYTRCAIDDSQGNLYIGHLVSGLSIVSLKNKTSVNFKSNPKNPKSIPSNEVYSIFIDSKKRIWIGTYDGLALFNKETKKFTVFKHNSNPGSLRANFIITINEINNEIWIGTVAGIEILEEQYGITENPDKVVFKHIPASDNMYGLSYPIVHRIIQDNFKNIWIGTLGGGVDFMTSKTGYFNTYTHTPNSNAINNLTKSIVLGLCIDSNNQLWAGVDGGGVDIFSNAVKIRNYSAENKAIPENRVLSFYKDAKNNIWLGTFNGHILCFNPFSKKFSSLTGFDPGIVQIKSFYEDKYHNLWIAAESGLYVYNRISGEKKSYNTTNSPLLHNVVRAVSGDNQGRIWVGLLGGGLQIFTPDFHLIKSYPVSKGFYGINHIYCDTKNRMWVSTRQGLILFNNNDTGFTTFSMKDGLADNYVRAVTEGTEDKIWISTNRGLSCLDVTKNHIQNFNQQDGIPLGNFMNGAVAKSSDGTIYFGSENGICYFNSNMPLPSYNLPPVYVTNFSVLDKKNTPTGEFDDLPVSHDINLTYKQSTFTISFNVPDYSLNDMIEFSYQLKGLDDSWYNIHNEKSLTFRNLRPGKYTFSIKKRLRNQDWSNTITTLEINIRPPFWFAWWAEIIYAIIILLTALYIVRFYKNKLNLENSLLYEKKTHKHEHELNEERLRFYTNITHELRTPLTLIRGPLEDLISNKSLEPSVAKKLNSIHRSANRLLELITQILEFRKSETHNRKLSIEYGNIATLVLETGLKYKELNQNKEVEIKIELPPGLTEMYYDSEVVTIILDNLISNALKYTSRGEIKLALQYVKSQEESIAEIIISDTGYGITADALPHIFESYYQEKGKHHKSGTGIGLSLVKNMVELHQGSIRVVSTPNQGTTFTIRFFTDNIYPDAFHAALHHPDLERVEENVPESISANQVMLIVEDNDEIRQYIRDCFAEKFEVLVAEDGKEGLKLAQESTPDIIISDILMPQMTGIELCKQIKDDIKTSHIPVILLTAKDTLQDKTEGYSMGADSYITKPFSANLLQSRVANLLEQRKKLSILYSTKDNEKRAIFNKSLNELDKKFIEKVTAIIESNLESDQINIVQIASRLNISHSTLYRKIKAVTGLTINDFIRKIQMKNAEELILSGKYKLNQIMYMVGINSTGHFRECFKEEFGITPKEYIQKIKDIRE
jgi:signal transduction histidine kinase/ligand-binding sensor domain-containing protein/DNA-binding response OmpR family regulator